MQKKITWAKADETIEKVHAKMLSSNADYIIIGVSNIPHGVVSKYDLQGNVCPDLQSLTTKRSLPQGNATLQIAVKWIMSKPVRTITPETSFISIMKNMHQFGRGPLLVTGQSGKVLGLVTPFSVLKVRALLKLESGL